MMWNKNAKVSIGGLFRRKSDGICYRAYFADSTTNVVKLEPADFPHLSIDSNMLVEQFDIVDETKPIFLRKIMD